MSDTPKSGMELMRESGPTPGEVIERLANENAALRERIAELEKAVVRAMEATAFASHDDSVGYRVCCDVRSYEPHKKNCYLRAALAKEKP